MPHVSFIDNNSTYSFGKLAYLIRINCLDLKRNNYTREYMAIQSSCKYRIDHGILDKNLEKMGDDGKGHFIKDTATKVVLDENTQAFEKVYYKIHSEKYKGYYLLVALNHEEGTYKIDLIDPVGKPEKNLVVGIYNPAKLKNDKFKIADVAHNEYFKYSYLDEELENVTEQV